MRHPCVARNVGSPGYRTDSEKLLGPRDLVVLIEEAFVSHRVFLGRYASLSSAQHLRDLSREHVTARSELGLAALARFARQLT
jgi:hypothetical protein